MAHAAGQHEKMPDGMHIAATDHIKDDAHGVKYAAQGQQY